MTPEEARAAFDEQVEVRWDGLIFDRIKAMRVEKVDGRDVPSLELVRIRDDGRGAASVSSGRSPRTWRGLQSRKSEA